MGITNLNGSELASLHSIIQQMENNNTIKPLRVKLRIQIVTLICAMGILGMDLIDGGGVSQVLGLSQFDIEIIGVICGFMLTVLTVLIVSSIFIIKDQADKDEMSSIKYLSRFKVIRLGAMLSDLTLQFLFILALLYFGKGIWIPPLLVFFTGHCIVQNYLFNFSQKQILVLTGFCYLVGISMLYIGIQSLVPALLLFIGINIFSIFITSWAAR